MCTLNGSVLLVRMFLRAASNGGGRVRRWRLLAILISFWISPVVEAQGSDTAALVGQLQSVDPRVRMTAFYALQPTANSSSDEVRLGLINLLQTEVEYEKSDPSLPAPDGHGSYFGELIDIVASFKDERAIGALSGAIDTGRIATSALAAFGQASLTTVITILNAGEAGHRIGAAVVLGQMLTPDNIGAVSDLVSLARMKQALVGAGFDNNKYVRMAVADGMVRLRQVTNPAAADVILDAGSLNQTYDGTPKTATVMTNPTGLRVLVTYAEN